jgi:ribA/ribD-fused uncharacterized protein
MDRETIYFYDRPSDRVKEENIFLNNFFDSPFEIDGKEYKSVEHFYQSCKFSGAEAEAVRLAANPDEAKKLAHQFTWREGEWACVRDDVMKRALQAKFGQNPELRKKLLDTGNCKLVEDSLRDPYWGGVLEGSSNRLGQLLEELRDHYRNT